MDEKNIIVEYIEDWLETEKRYLDAGDTDSLKRFMKELGNEPDRLCNYH